MSSVIHIRIPTIRTKVGYLIDPNGQYFKKQIKKLLKHQGIDARVWKARMTGWIIVNFEDSEDKMLFIVANNLKELQQFKGYYDLADIK